MTYCQWLASDGIHRLEDGQHTVEKFDMTTKTLLRCEADDQPNPHVKQLLLDAANELEASYREQQRLRDCLFAISKAPAEVDAAIIRGVAYDVVANLIGNDVAEHQLVVRAHASALRPAPEVAWYRDNVTEEEMLQHIAPKQK